MRRPGHAGKPHGWPGARTDVAFSKFDPQRPTTKGEEGSTPAATRRARVLRWGNWILMGMTVLGFVLMAYWITKR